MAVLVISNSLCREKILFFISVPIDFNFTLRNFHACVDIPSLQKIEKLLILRLIPLTIHTIVVYSSIHHTHLASVISFKDTGWSESRQ